MGERGKDWAVQAATIMMVELWMFIHKEPGEKPRRVGRREGAREKSRRGRDGGRGPGRKAEEGGSEEGAPKEKPTRQGRTAYLRVISVKKVLAAANVMRVDAPSGLPDDRLNLRGPCWNGSGVVHGGPAGDDEQWRAARQQRR
jgi:hypothetical protein